MPTRYTNGTANASGNYSGVTIADETTLLTTIRDELVAAGQAIHLDEISSSKKLIMNGSNNSHNCYVIFETELVTGVNYKLKITGDSDGTETLKSGTLQLDFAADGQCRLFMTSDESAGCIMPYNPSSSSQSAHFGFPKRTDKNYEYSWMVGYLDIYLTDAYVRRSRVGQEDWKEHRTFFYSAAESNTGPQGPYQHLWDSFTTAFVRTNYTQIQTTNFAYRPWLGAVDPATGLPILGLFGYIEGNTDHNSYANPDTTRAFPLHFPGAIKFARTGFCAIETGIQAKEEEIFDDNGTQKIKTELFISGGAKERFQGFKIAETIADT